MGSGQKASAFASIALSDSRRNLRVPAQLASSLIDAGPSRFLDQTVHVYPEGQLRYLGSAVGIKTGQAEALDRGSQRALHGRAYLDGEVAILTDARDDEVARAYPIDDRQLQIKGVGAEAGVLLAELVRSDDGKSVLVYDRWLKRRGTVKAQSRRGQREQVDLRLAGVAAYFFLLAE